jgi:Domain of unknown function (DUF4292)
MRRRSIQAAIPLFLVVSFALFLLSCSAHKKITATQPKTANASASTSLKKEKAYSLMTALKANHLKYHWISARFSADITSNDSSDISFNGVVRIRKDSVIWLTVSVALGAYTALHAKLGIDSVMYIDHPNEQYFKGTYDYLDTLLKEDIDYDMIQAVMVGRHLDFYHDTSKIKAYFDGKDYILSTIRKREYKKLMYRNRPLHSHNEAQLIWLDDSDFHIKKIRLEDFVTKHTFEASYDDFQKQDSGGVFPMHIHYIINTGKKSINIDLKYKKINFTNSESIPFIIPKKYVQVHY